jgi:hypothetical protein
MIQEEYIIKMNPIQKASLQLALEAYEDHLGDTVSDLVHTKPDKKHRDEYEEHFNYVMDCVEGYQQLLYLRDQIKEL